MPLLWTTLQQLSPTQLSTFSTLEISSSTKRNTRPLPSKTLETSTSISLSRSPNSTSSQSPQKLTLSEREKATNQARLTSLLHSLPLLNTLSDLNSTPSPS